MVKRLLVVSLAASLLLTCTSRVAFAKVGVADLKAHIKQENVLPGELTVTANATEVVVATYRDQTAADRDCKIDAVLTAKAVFAKDPEVSRVVVRFHDVRNTASYTEVPVTLAEVTAYGAGVVSKDQLLSGMKLTTVVPEQPTAPPEPEVSVEDKAKPEPEIQRPKTTTKKVAASNYAHYAAYGLCMQYPQGWTASAPKGTNVLVRFHTRGTSDQPSLIDLRVYDGKKFKPETLVSLPPKHIFGEAWSTAFTDSLPDGLKEIAEFARLKAMQMRSNPEYQERRRRYAERVGDQWPGVQVARVAVPDSIGIGPTKSIKALQKAYWAKGMGSPREYLRTVAFSSPSYTYQLALVAPDKDSASADQDFEKLLSLLSLPAAKPVNRK